MNRTNIEWTDYTWNPITGCTRGCSYCYARRMAYRLRGRAGYPADDPFRPTFHSDRLLEPIRLKKPSRIFTVSMGDMFDHTVPRSWREAVLNVMHNAKQHVFQVLTKQPTHIDRMTEDQWPSNLCLGISVDGKTVSDHIFDQFWDAEYPHTRFVSFEPLLGSVGHYDLMTSLTFIDWVIIGAQTGPVTKQPIREWIDDIIKAADHHNIPVFIKDNVKIIDDRERRQEWPKL